MKMEKRVRFMGSDLLSVRCEETGKIYVSVKSICSGLGMTEEQVNSQRQKLKRDELLKLSIKKLSVNFHGQVRELSFIELDYLPAWLFKINPARFNNGLKDKLLQYQLKAKDVLAEAFLGRRERETTGTSGRVSSMADKLKTISELENQMEELTSALKFHYASLAMNAETAFEELESSPHSKKGDVEKYKIDGKTFISRKLD
jgi:hypothetical protein